MKERRLFQRIPKQLKANCIVADNKKNKIPAAITDIGGGGAHITTDQELPPGTPINLEILSTTGKSITKLLGKILWLDEEIEANNHHLYSMGIKFDNPDLVSIGQIIH